MPQQVLEYARPGTIRRLRPFVFVPGRISRAGAISSTLCVLVALPFFPKYMAVRSYEPDWYQWVAPVMTWLALGLALVALLPDEQRRRVALRGGGVAMALGLCCALGLIFSPRIIVCGESADRVKCASNLKQLALGMLLYGQGHGGSLPPDLPTLFLTQDLTADAFVCPVSHDRVAKGEKTRATAAKLSGAPHCSYVYVGAGLTTSAAATAVVAYEPASNHSGDGANVLFGDGHVEFIGARQLPAMLAPTTAPASRPAAASAAR